HAIDVLQPQLSPVRQRRHLERSGENARDVGPREKHFAERPPEIAQLRRQREDPVRLVVHQRHGAVAVDRDDAVAHAVDDLAKKPIPQKRHTTRGPAAGPRPRSAVAATGAYDWASRHGGTCTSASLLNFKRCTWACW